MTKPTNYCAFYRPAGSYTVERQRRVVLAWLKEHGGTISQEYDASELPGARDEWVGRTRPKEGAIIAALWLVAEPRTKDGRRPTTDQALALAALERAAAIIVEAETGITSHSKKWPERLAEANDMIAGGRRRLSKRELRVLAEARAEKAEPGTKDKWKDAANKRKFDRWQAHWMSKKFKSGPEAYNAIPKAVRDEIGGYRMMYDIFGPRGTGHGGRPRKQKRKGK